jgi:anti-anti-sigma regulatory factor
MFRIKADTESNLIILQLAGDFDAGQAVDLLSSFSKHLAKMRPGFKLLTDLSKLKSMEIEAHKSIEYIMDLSNNKGVAQVVRVITNNELDIGFNIMSLFHYSKKVEIQTCSSLNEAKNYLKQSNCRRR